MASSKGWKCPKCGQVNAIWVETCPCYKKPEPTIQQEKWREAWVSYGKAIGSYWKTVGDYMRLW